MMPDVLEALAQALEHCRANTRQIARHQLHREQAEDDRNIAEPVEEKTSSDSDYADQDAGDGGPDHARAVEDHRVERDRVGQILAPDHLDHEGLACRHVKSRHQAVHRGQYDHVLDPHRAGPGKRRQDERAQHQQHLGGDDQPAAVGVVDDYAGKQRHQ